MQQSTTRLRRNPGSVKKPDELHPAWQTLMELCRKLGHGEIERLKIQDGLPVFAEKIIEKIKLT